MEESLGRAAIKATLFNKCWHREPDSYSTRMLGEDRVHRAARKELKLVTARYPRRLRGLDTCCPSFFLQHLRLPRGKRRTLGETASDWGSSLQATTATDTHEVTVHLPWPDIDMRRPNYGASNLGVGVATSKRTLSILCC